MKSSAEKLQAAYYERTAAAYDEVHNSGEEHEHNLALSYMAMISEHLGLRSFLDVGAGTGRGVQFLLNRKFEVRGVEPVPALIQKAEANGVPAGLIVEGSGYELPFSDGSFDAVIECGVLHHVPEPARMVAEMIRVAKHAVFLSDSNRFGQGRYPFRLVKLALYKLGLWPAARFIQTKGKMYTISEEDGIAYSTVFSTPTTSLPRRAQGIWLPPTAPDNTVSGKWAHPLLNATHVLLSAFKD